MGDSPYKEQRTVRLDMKQLYRQAIELAGQEQADRLWAESRLDSDEEWSGKWATAMEIVERLREQAKNRH